MSTMCIGQGAVQKPWRLWQGLGMSLNLVEAVVGVWDSMGRVLRQALLSVPLLLSPWAFSSPHGVSVALHHSAEVHRAARAQRGWDKQVPLCLTHVQGSPSRPFWKLLWPALSAGSTGAAPGHKMREDDLCT